MYDKNNIFAKIIRREIPCEAVYEDDKVLFFYDVRPQAKIHILGIPKKNVIDFIDFVSTSENEEIQYFFSKTEEVIKKIGINRSGFKIISNSGKNGGQEIPHFHIHILGGENLTKIK